MKKKLFKKLTIIDILIIICIVGAIGFAIFHMTADKNEATAVSFDSSTITKFSENYLNLYKEGKVIKTTIVGTDAKTGEEKVTYKGTIEWVGYNNGKDITALINCEGKEYLAGLYKDNPNTDIYIDQITVETDGRKYQNITDIKISSENISTIGDLISKLPNDLNYELSTNIAISQKDSQTYQTLLNRLSELKKPAITITSEPLDNLKIIRGDKITLQESDKILGNINGKTDVITLRIYNSTDNDLNIIKSNFNVLNTKTIS